MPVPALVIGLGGTGAIVATHVKKELMESAGAWPLKEVKILVFDTDTNAAKSATVGASGQVRLGGLTTGGVQLREGGEFHYIGGFVKPLVEQIAAGQHPHIGRWLQADAYLKELSLPDSMYNLNVGAGQFRQFGRLAIFRDMNDAAARKVYNTISDAMSKIKQGNPTLKGLEVFIVGSVAGGTGAGMFADVAHLVRKISELSTIQLSGKIQIRGYLVLPEAFSRTIGVDTLKEMHARAFAAMRENRRFTINFDHERGYPIPYREVGADPIWNGAVKGQLFDLLYYIDGQAGEAATASLKDGVAPSLADAISAAIDGEAGPAFSSYVVNVKAVYGGRIGRRALAPKTPTFGALGTYSIVFPVYHIVESWTHDLARQLLGDILAPISFDPRSGIPTQLAADQNQEDPGQEGRSLGFDFLNSPQAMAYEYIDRNGQTQSEAAEATLLPAQLWHIAAAARRNDSNILPELIERQIDDWQEYFMPEGQDEETRRLLDRVKATLNARLYDVKEGGEVMASSQLKRQQKEEPVAAADRIARSARAFSMRYLGSPDSYGRRSGGLYRKTLDEIVAYHVERFNKRLDLLILSSLNGNPNNPQTLAKGGKVGFLIKFLDGLFDALELARAKLQEAQDQRREAGEGYRAAVARVETARRNMVDIADKKGFLTRLTNREAYNAQHRYLEAEVELINRLKVEATEEGILKAVKRMIDYVRSARESLQTWEQALARDTEGLYAQVLRGRGLTDNDRRAARDAKVRLIVSDETYEKARYHSYLNRLDGGWINELLGKVQWGLEHQKVAGQSRLALHLQVRDGQQEKSFALDIPEDNLKLWLELCRRPFQPAYHEESVLSYLMQHREYRDASRLAEYIHGRGGIMLRVSGGQPLPGNFLRAYYLQDAETGHADYLRTVVDRLAGLSGQSVGAEDLDAANKEQKDENQPARSENRFVQFLSSEDRFKFTFVFTQELIELDYIDSYRQTGWKEYLGEGGMAQGNRTILHTFPAEVNATRYEGRLTSLQQAVRMFVDEVTLQLEDLPRVKLFMLCYIHGLIRRASVQDKATGTLLNLWQLCLEPERSLDDYGNPTQPLEIWLTQPQVTPHIIDALTTFNYEEKDARFKQGFVQTIDYHEVANALRRAREADVKSRLENSTAGANSPDLLHQAAAVDADTRQTILHDLARIDRVREYQNRFKNEFLPGLAQRKEMSNDPQAAAAEQKDYDLISIFALMLDDEVQVVRQTVRNRLRPLRNLGQRAVADDESVKQGDEADTLDNWTF
jgi:hypothetical protein